MTDSPRRLHFVADRGDARLRLDRVLVRRLTQLSRVSRTTAREWIAAGLVTVDGRTVRKGSGRIREGARVALEPPASASWRERPRAEPLPLDILHADARFLVINKPAGVAVHPTYKRTSGTLLNAVLFHLAGRSGTSPGIVTRLDKDTSGLVLVALDSATHRRFARDAAEGRVEKHYLAVVRGWPRPRRGDLRAPLARDPDDRRRMVVSSVGAASHTRYEVVREFHAGGEPRALVACRLLTGRTHQIRVHLASAGWAIVGDRVYGAADAAIGRQALHAARLTLHHPQTAAPIVVEAPLPDDMRPLVPDANA